MLVKRIRKWIILILMIFLFLNIFKFSAFIIILLLSRKPQDSGERYTVVRLDAESNLSESGSNYYYQEGNGIYHYSIRTDESEMVTVPLKPAEYLDEFTVWNNIIYYTAYHDRRTELRWFDYVSEEAGTVLSWEELCSLYHAESSDEMSSAMYIRSYGDSLLLQITGKYGNKVYFSLLDGSVPVNFSELGSLSSEVKKVCGTEETVYAGMVVGRQYETDKEGYVITKIVKEKNGRSILKMNIRYMKVGGNDVFLWKESRAGGFWYCNGENKKIQKTISCLNGEEYEYSELDEDKMVEEDGKIIGLVYILNDWRSNWSAPNQSDLVCDILFILDPETGESSILYKTEDNRTRIIGYQNGTIYLFRNYKIYERPLEGIKSGSMKMRLLCKLPESDDYLFDWQGDYLLVMNTDSHNFGMAAVLPVGQD